MRPLHVLLLTSAYPTPERPARGIFFRDQAYALLRNGMHVGVIAAPRLRSLRTLLSGSASSRHVPVGEFLEVEDGLPTARGCRWGVPGAARLNRILWMKEVHRLIALYISRYGRPDLMHAHGALWAGAAAARIADKDLPYVVTEHSTAYARGLILSWQERFVRSAFERASAVLTVSAGLGKQISRYLATGEPIVVPNVVDTTFFTLPPATREAEPFRFLTVAFLTPKKGIDVLLRAFAAGFGEGADVVLEIGGGGAQQPELEALAAQLGVADRVRFLGQLSREEVRAAMWRAHTFVLPSHSETFGVVLIEAMATGLPVIATRSGGPEDFVEEAVGSLVQPGDAEALKSELQSVHAGRDGLAHRAERIRQVAVERFGERALVERLRVVYTAVIGSERAGR